MKIYIHYNAKTNNAFLTLTTDILQSDEMLKSIGFKPMDFITTGLQFSLETPIIEKRLFSGLRKKPDGGLVVDDFGDLVQYREQRNICVTLTQIVDIHATEQYMNFFETSDYMSKCFNEEMKVFIKYGDNYKYEFKTLAKYDLNAFCNKNELMLIKLSDGHTQLLVNYLSKTLTEGTCHV
jgi:hypothetical protein